MRTSEAEIAYFKIIPNNIEFILAIIIIIFMLLLFRMLLNSYKRYFDETVIGINKLMGDEKQLISLSSELEFVEHKLNNVKQTLETRTAEAQQAERQKNDLVVYLAHDIKTPLTSVLGYLSLLNENADMPNEQKSKYINIAWEKASKLEALVNEFFEITRYSLQSIPLRKESIDLCFMIVQISVEQYPQLASRGKEIENSVDEKMTVFGDSEKLARVFNNILKNAIAYGKDNSTIKISAEELPGKTVIRFENEGAIPEDKLDAVFDKFYRVNSARSSDTGGAGLGLTIAKDIVELHGGEIRAESDGGNTVIIVELPSAPDLLPPSE
jgi:two-component system sensor histidine kinase VanS